MKVDIVYPASSRPEFTVASLCALARNTDWNLVRRMIVYTDGALLMSATLPRKGVQIDERKYGGPVAIMLKYLARDDAADIFAKIDNDVIVPPGWLNRALEVMEQHEELDLLGLEPPASRTPAPWDRSRRRPAPEDLFPFDRSIPNYALCEAIGGVGLMRKSAFARRRPMVPHSIYGGFTDWQLRHPEVLKGWIVPPIALFLLDRLPIEPWASLSKRYIAEGAQRPWTNYDSSASPLWEWWDDD